MKVESVSDWHLLAREIEKLKERKRKRDRVGELLNDLR